MSVVTQINGSEPNYLWILAALPVGLGLDFAFGNVPGRSAVVGGMKRLIEMVDAAVDRAVTRLGGGRGGDLFGGILLTVLVVGIVSCLVWLMTDLSDSIGGLATLVVRALLIAAGLAIRATADQILLAAEAPDQPTARQWLQAVGGHSPGRLDQVGVDPTCVAAIGEATSSVVVAPLFWLAVGGPATLWGFLALRSLREAALSRSTGPELTGQVTTVLADLAEAVPGWLTWVFVGLAAGATRANPIRAWRTGWQAGRTHPRIIPVWGQASLAGALGVRILAGRTFSASRTATPTWVGEPIQPIDGLAVIRSVRIMQVTAFLAAGLVVLVMIVW